MARALDTDPLMLANFALRELASTPVPTTILITPNQPIDEILDAKIFTESLDPSNSYIGFQNLSIPDVGVQFEEINEGNWPFTHKVPITRATVGDVTITKAVLKTSSDFYSWIYQTLWGRGSPRRNFMIEYLDRTKGFSPRQIKLYHCLPVSWKPGEDFDANSSDVSIESLTFNVERIEIEWSFLSGAFDL